MKSTSINRRTLVTGGLTTFGIMSALGWINYRRTAIASGISIPTQTPHVEAKTQTMPYRKLGKTDLLVSEVGFGAWGIGGKAYGAVDTQDALQALARAEELGCNFVDTAQVYGNSEAVLGNFLRGRRSKWLIATKYSGQQPSLTATVEQQLKTLGTDVIDLYQIHWVPREPDLYNELYALKKAGKIRYIGVSAQSIGEIEYAIDNTQIDSIQLPFSLLDPNPFLGSLERIKQSGMGVIIRSSLKEGFLAGKFKATSKFPDPNDQRHAWSPEQIARTVEQVEKFRFLEADTGSMATAAIAYPLSFPEVSTVILGTKNQKQADENFSKAAGLRLSQPALQRIWQLQDQLDLAQQRKLRSVIKRVLGRKNYA